MMKGICQRLIKSVFIRVHLSVVALAKSDPWFLFSF